MKPTFRGISRFHLSQAQFLASTLDLWRKPCRSSAENELLDSVCSELIDRAIHAFWSFRSSDQVWNLVNVMHVADKHYVVLIAVEGVEAAVYRVRTCGRLKLLRRLPVELKQLVDEDRKRLCLRHGLAIWEKQ